MSATQPMKLREQQQQKQSTGATEDVQADKPMNVVVAAPQPQPQLRSTATAEEDKKTKLVPLFTRLTKQVIIAFIGEFQVNRDIAAYKALSCCDALISLIKEHQETHGANDAALGNALQWIKQFADKDRPTSSILPNLLRAVYHMSTID